MVVQGKNPMTLPENSFQKHLAYGADGTHLGCYNQLCSVYQGFDYEHIVKMLALLLKCDLYRKNFQFSMQNCIYN